MMSTYQQSPLVAKAGYYTRSVAVVTWTPVDGRPQQLNDLDRILFPDDAKSTFTVIHASEDVV